MVAWKNGRKGGTERLDLNGKMSGLRDYRDCRRKDGRMRPKN
jgi:hypothetical protein